MNRVGWKNLFNINKILKVLVASDVIIFSGWGLMSPVFAVFVTEQIPGATLVTVGIAEAIYLATKSILQIPIGMKIDETEGEKIDFWLAFLGSILSAIAILLYILAKSPLHIYLIEFLFGVAGAISYPAWMGLFSRNIEEGRESFLWGMHSTTTELSWAVTAVLGGFVAEKFGFGSLFLTAGTIALLGSLVLFVVYREIATE
ncbi:MFS transporter [Candidatus Woesebacteria bacterium]|nr:MFS transporter [Candidatus Woesebacteria bacterium]